MTGYRRNFIAGGSFFFERAAGRSKVLGSQGLNPILRAGFKWHHSFEQKGPPQLARP
jgi:hypothetical protein